MPYSKTTPRQVRAIRRHRNSNVNTGGEWSDWTNAVAFSESWNDSVTYGDSTRNWRALVRAGGNATTDAVGEVRELTLNDGSVHYEDEPTGLPHLHVREEAIGTLLAVGFPSSLLTMSLDSARNQALKNYYSNLAAEASRFKGLTFAAELAESLRMIRNPAKALRRGVSDYLSHLKRGGRLPRHRRPSFVRETWLEYAFGWRPLISDLDGAMKQFFSNNTARTVFSLVKGSGREVKLQSSFIHSNPVTASCYAHALYTETEEAFVQYYGIYRGSANGSQDNHSYGFSPWEIVPTIYEVIPYSFLVDYFTNIGAIVESWSYCFLRGDWTSELVRRSAKLKTSNEVLFFYPGLGNGSINGSPGSMASERKTFTRTRSVPLELPSFEFKLPGFTSQWVNILALSKNVRNVQDILAS